MNPCTCRLSDWGCPAHSTPLDPGPYYDGFEWELQIDRISPAVTITSWRAREAWARTDAKRTPQ